MPSNHIPSHPDDFTFDFARRSSSQPVAFDLQATLALMDGAYAPNTIRAIRADVERWLSYCRARG